MQEEFSIDELAEIVAGLDSRNLHGNVSPVNETLHAYFLARLAIARRQASRG